MPTDLLRHWKVFLPFWLTPFLVMGGKLVEDFVPSRGLFWFVAALTIIWFFGTYFVALVMFRRRAGRKCGPAEFLLLSTPMFVIWALLVFARGIVFTILGRPL